LHFLRLPFVMTLVSIHSIIVDAKVRSAYLSTAATMGETVTAAVKAVVASTKILVNIFPRSLSESAAIPSMELGGEA
jgi:hypothetical protein